MGRPCTICTHPQRAEIDAALARGVPFRRIAAQYGLALTSVRRHHANHLPANLAQAAQAAEFVRVERLLAELVRLHAQAGEIAEEARKAKAYGPATAAIREQTRILELLLRVAGELKEGPLVQINTNWAELRSLILAALDPYPEARQRLLEALRGVA